MLWSQRIFLLFKPLISNYQRFLMGKYGYFDNNEDWQITKQPKGYDFWMIHLLSRIIKNHLKYSDNT